METPKIENIFYLTFRLFPILLPMYFIISSIFSQDIRGVIYLAGLLFACIFSCAISGSLDSSQLINTKNPSNPLQPNPQCYLMSGNPDRPFSWIPLSQTIYSYTFFYILFIIGAYSTSNTGKHKNSTNKQTQQKLGITRSQHLWRKNWPTILFLGILMIADIAWNLSNHCTTKLAIFFAFIIGSVGGVVWACMISMSGAVNLQYFNGLSNEMVCSRTLIDSST